MFWGTTMRKWLLRVFVAVMVGAAVTGCGNGTRPPTEEEIRKYEEEHKKAVEQEAQLQHRTDQEQ
jgi:uncharacterized membrane protein YgaE (UPF0421/DUF939 family)